MKFCKTCEMEKSFEFFRKSKRHKDGYMSECKDCVAKKRSEYYYSRHEHFRNQNKEYYENNKDIIYQNLDKDKKKERDRRYMEKNRERLKIKKLDYYYANREEILDKRKEHYEKNKDILNHMTERKREIKRKSYQKRKYQFAWRNILRRTLNQLKIQKDSNTLDILGYNYESLKIHLESKFIENMSWENYGEWHVDHIIPISRFKEDTPPSIVNRLDNLRPLWSNENLRRQNSLDDISEEYQYLIVEFSKYLK